MNSLLFLQCCFTDFCQPAPNWVAVPLKCHPWGCWREARVTIIWSCRGMVAVPGRDVQSLCEGKHRDVTGAQGGSSAVPFALTV